MVQLYLKIIKYTENFIPKTKARTLLPKSKNEVAEDTFKNLLCITGYVTELMFLKVKTLVEAKITQMHVTTDEHEF